MSTVKMNGNWKRDLEKQALAQIKDHFQPILDDVFKKMNGRPVDEVKPVLKKRWESANDGAKITDPDLTKYATAISEGKMIVLK